MSISKRFVPSASPRLKEVEEALNKGYETFRRESKFNKKKSFAPSTIAYGHGTCARYWYYGFKGGVVQDNNPAESIATMQNGTDAGKRIAKAFEASGYLVDAERKAEIVDPPIFGFIDVILKLPGYDEEVLGEIKTTRLESWNFRYNTGKPLKYHRYQILIYLKATGLKHGFFVYENRNDQTVTLIPIAMDEDNEAIIERCFDWLRTVKKAIDKDQLPTRPKGWTVKNKNCRGCPFYESCWANKADAGVVTIPVMEVEEPA